MKILPPSFLGLIYFVLLCWVGVPFSAEPCVLQFSFIFCQQLKFVVLLIIKAAFFEIQDDPTPGLCAGSSSPP